MSILWKILLFLAGLLLSAQVIASLYRVVDLRYCIREAAGRVAGGIVLWAGGCALLALVLGPGYRDAFVWGLGAFAVWHVAFFWLMKLRAGHAVRRSMKGQSA